MSTFSVKTFRRLMMILLLPVCLCSCRTEIFPREALPDLEEDRLKNRNSSAPLQEPRDRVLQSRLVIERLFFSISCVCMIRIQGNLITAAGILPAGIKLFEVSGTPEKLESFHIPDSSPFPGADQREKAAGLLKDLHNIFTAEPFIYRESPAGFRQERTAKILHLIHPVKGIRMQYGYRPLRLLKKSEKNQASDWQTEYYRCIVRGSGLYPAQIVYQNKKGGYSLIFRVYDLHFTGSP